MTDAITDGTIQQNAEGPRRVRADGVEVDQHALADQIAADKYIEAKRAVRRTGVGLKFVRIIPGGAD